MKFVENVEKKDYQNFTLKHAKSHFLPIFDTLTQKNHLNLGKI